MNHAGDRRSAKSAPATRINGVFSTKESQSPKDIGTRSSSSVKRYWICRQVNDEQVQVQPTNEKLVRIGKARTVPLKVFLDTFEPEPEFYIQAASFRQTPSGKKAEPQKTGDVIEGFTVSGGPEEIERNARAGFGIGMTYLKRGNRSKAVDIFDRLAGVEADFQAEHKHMFNDFGISLRKERLFQCSLKHYDKALELSEYDEHIHHNLARVYFEMREVDMALRCLKRSLELNPELKESLLFLNYLQKRSRL
jgi:tetratricopeptide (TPR) repeat protein